VARDHGESTGAAHRGLRALARAGQRPVRGSLPATAAVTPGSPTTLEAAIFDRFVVSSVYRYRFERAPRDATVCVRRRVVGDVHLADGGSMALPAEPAIRVAALGKLP
jgi:hypothetical protein